MGTTANAIHREPWDKGKIVGQKARFKLKDIWALRVRFQMENRVREPALFNLGIDSKLRGCDLVGLQVRDICHGNRVATRAMVMQHKAQRAVQFEITPATRDAVQKWIKQAGLKPDGFVFPSRIHDSPHLGTRRYARTLEHWVQELGLDPADYGTRSMRRTKATLIYRRTKNLRPSNYCLATARLSRRFDTLASRWTMPWRSPSRPRSDGCAAPTARQTRLDCWAVQPIGGNAVAAQNPTRVTAWAVIDAPLPGMGSWDKQLTNPKVWHFNFRGPDVERLVAGRERILLDRF